MDEVTPNADYLKGYDEVIITGSESGKKPCKDNGSIKENKSTICDFFKKICYCMIKLIRKE